MSPHLSVPIVFFRTFFSVTSSVAVLAAEVSIASLANISVLMYRSPGFLIVSPATEGAVLAARAAPVEGVHRLPWPVAMPGMVES